MAKPTREIDFKVSFTARVRWARLGRGYTQVQMAELLGSLDPGKYKQYETRSYLPHILVPRFCLLCGVDSDWLFTGKGRAPAIPEPPRRQRAAASRRTRTAA